MNTYVRLAYASQSTASSNTIRAELNNIINISTLRNPPSHISGVLYYGNNHFFQCLEGKRTVIDALFERIKQDTRHTNIVMLSYETINHPIFESWGTKYYALDKSVQHFFAQHNLPAHFDPFLLKGQLIQPFIQMIKSKQEVECVDYDDSQYLSNTMGDMAGTVTGQQYMLFMMAIALVMFGLIYIYTPSLKLVSGF